MSFARVDLLIDVDNRILVKTPTEVIPVSAAARPRFVYADTLVLACSFVDKNGDAYVLHAGDTFDCGLDDDFEHNIDTGTAAAGYSGAVTSIQVSGLTQQSTIPDTGHIVLINGADQSDRVAYTAFDDVDTFTVSTTLSNTYLLGDTVEVQDDLMAYSDDTQVDIAGDWSSIDRTTGKISIRINCNTDAFLRKIADANSNGQLLTWLQIRRVPNGETENTTMLQDFCYAYDSVIGSLGGAGNTFVQYLTQTAADARYLQVYANYSEIGAALADADQINVFDDGTSTVVKSNMSRVTTYVNAGTGIGTLSNADRIVGVASAGAVKELTIEEGSITGLLTFSKTGTTARTVTFPDRVLSVAGVGASSTSQTLPKWDASGDLTDSTIAEGSITGLLTIAKAGTTARTVTFPDRVLTVAGTGAATTSGTLAKFDASGNLTDSLLIDNIGTGSLTIVKSGTTARTLTFGDRAYNLSSVYSTDGTNFGVGIAPTKKLHVYGGDVFVQTAAGVSSAFRLSSGTNASPGIASFFFGTSDSTELGAIRYTSGAGLMRFLAASSEVARFQGGNFGVGATTIARKFEALEATTYQIRETYTDNVVYTDHGTDASGYYRFEATGGNYGFGLTPTANMVGIAVEGGLLTLKETTTPTADAGYAKIYSKTDNKLYFQDGAGTEHDLSSGGAGVSFLYEYDSTTSKADPGAGKFRGNNATISSITEFYVDDIDADGIDMSSTLNNMGQSDQILLKSAVDAATEGGLFTVTSITDEGGYYTIAVTYNDSGSSGTWTDATDFGILPLYNKDSNYACIFFDDNATVTTIPLTESFVLVTDWDTDCPDSVSTSDQANNKIDVGLTGDYDISISLTGSSALANKSFSWTVFEVSSTATTITAATQANPVVVTASGHGLSNGNKVKITGVSGMTEINDRVFTVAGVSGADFNLQDDSPANIDGTGFTAYTTGGTVQLVTDTNVHTQRDFGTSNGSTSNSGIASMTGGSDLELYIKNITDANNFTHETATLKMVAPGGGTISTVGVGDVIGPGSSTDEAFARFDSTTGKLIQNSNITCTDAGAITVAGNFTLPTTDGTNGQVLETNGSGTVSWQDATGTTVEDYRATGHAGYGSTNTKIPYYTTEDVDNISTLGTIANSATNGWSFTASAACEVNLSAWVQSAVTNYDIGISLNSAALTTNISAISQTDVMDWAVAPGAGTGGHTSCSVVLANTDVIRIHTNGESVESSRSGVRMTVTAL